MQYKKKPFFVDALQCKEPNTIADIIAFCPCAQPSDGGDNGLQWVFIETLEGTITANYGDYVIKGFNGVYYTCKPDIFEAMYDPVPLEKTEQNQTADNRSSLKRPPYAYRYE